MLNTYENQVKAKLKSGEKTAGAWIQSCCPMMAEILSRGGFDWLLIDMEHSPLSYETLVSVIQAMQGYPAVPFVRAPWNDMVSIKRILDCGAYGIIVPYVETKEEAQAAVRACKYPTLGNRGVAGSSRGADYGLTKERMKVINDQVCVITQIETPKSIDNLDEILTVDGLDGLFIGPMDLATSMGHFCDPKHPEVQAAIRAVEDKVLNSGKFLGTVSASWEEAEALYRRGYQFVTLMSDTTSMAALARKTMNQFHDVF